jgi:hypothetical protein
MSSEIQSMSQNAENKVKAEITFGDLKASFSGDPESVLHSINSFIGKDLPTYNIAKKLWLSFTAKEVAEKFQEFIRLTPEGPRVWSQGKKLSDKEVVALQLAGQIVAHGGGMVASASMSLSALQEATSMIPKTLSSRLSELSKSGLVARESGEQGSVFRLTTQGVSWLSEVLSKKTP